MFQFFSYIIFLIISFTMLITLSIRGLKYKDNNAVKEFIGLMLVLAWWSFCQAFELMAMTFGSKLFWANLVYTGAGLSPFFFLMFTMRFCGYHKYLTKRNISIVLLIYLALYILIFTDPYHGLMRYDFHLDTSQIPYVIVKKYGTVFPLYILFTYAMNAISLIILFMNAIRKQALYKKQVLLLFMALAVMSFSNILYILKLTPFTRFDTAPAFLGVAALLLSFALFRHRLLDIMPIARDLLMDKMTSGIIVVDKNNSIVDINHAGQEIFQLDKSSIIGINAFNYPILSKYLPLVENEEHPAVAVMERNGNENIYELKMHSFYYDKEKQPGKVYVISDITEQQKNLEKIIEQQKALSVMHERENIGRDLHDGLGQMFGFYSTQAQTVKEYMKQKKYDLAMEHLGSLISVAKDAHSDIREYIMEMGGVSARNRNFSATLKQYVAGYSEKFNIQVNVVFDDRLPVQFPEEAQGIQLLKIIQEALNNIRKHAGKCIVSITFTQYDRCVELCITDTRKGFKVEQQTTVHQYGLSIMRERAVGIGASFDIKSNDNIGTKIIVRMGDGAESENCNC